MRRAGLVFVLLTAAALAATPPAPAFTGKVRAEIARRATTMMPKALARQLRRCSGALEQAALDGRDGSPAEPVRALDPGDADQQLALAIDDVVNLMNARAPMDDVARAFGRIARAAADLSFALNIGPEDPRAPDIYADFARYCESRLRRMSLTFGGYTDEDLARADVLAFARRTAASARRDYDRILNSYFPPGRRPTAQDFDDRSVPFAAASLETSLALTTTARAWLFAWWRANGDVTGTPLLNPSDLGAPPPPDSSPPPRPEKRP